MIYDVKFVDINSKMGKIISILEYKNTIAIEKNITVNDNDEITNANLSIYLFNGEGKYPVSEEIKDIEIEESFRQYFKKDLEKDKVIKQLSQDLLVAKESLKVANQKEEIRLRQKKIDNDITIELIQEQNRTQESLHNYLDTSKHSDMLNQIKNIAFDPDVKDFCITTDIFENGYGYKLFLKTTKGIYNGGIESNE